MKAAQVSRKQTKSEPVVGDARKVERSNSTRQDQVHDTLTDLSLAVKMLTTSMTKMAIGQFSSVWISVRSLEVSRLEYRRVRLRTGKNSPSNPSKRRNEIA